MTSDVDGLRFRELLPGDEDGLCRLFVDNSVPEVQLHFHPFPLSVEMARRLTRDDRRDRYYVAEAEWRILAFSMLRGWDEGYEAPSFGIFVDHHSHGRGVGGRLTDFTIDQARRLGCPRVRLSVYASNSVAYRMYLTRGFIEQSREPVEASKQMDERIVMFKELR